MKPPHPAHRPSFVLTLGMLIGVAALTVDLSLPAIPFMVKALATTLPRGQQIVGVFIAGMACGQIPAGLISDRIGRLPMLYAGMALFTVAAAVAALASDINVVLAARFAQGCGAAAPIVLSRAIVRDVARGREAARLMSLLTMIFTAAPVIAPTIGALLVSQWGWRSPFIVITLLGLVIILSTQRNLHETHTPDVDVHPVRQLRQSFAEFFSHRQSIFGLLLIVLPPAGYMSIITVSAALAVEIYGFTVTAYGLIFATAGMSILAGAFLNRLLVARFESLQLIGLGAALMGIAAAQLLLIAWLNAAPFAWLWSCVCLFMVTVPLTAANATVIALDPLPRIAGVASSIIGTTQNVLGAGGALLGAAIYDGTPRKTILIIAMTGLLTAAVFLLRPLIVPAGLVRHPDELARD